MIIRLPPPPPSELWSMLPESFKFPFLSWINFYRVNQLGLPTMEYPTISPSREWRGPVASPASLYLKGLSFSADFSKIFIVGWWCFTTLLAFTFASSSKTLFNGCFPSEFIRRRFDVSIPLSILTGYFDSCWDLVDSCCNLSCIFMLSVNSLTTMNFCRLWAARFVIPEWPCRLAVDPDWEITLRNSTIECMICRKERMKETEQMSVCIHAACEIITSISQSASCYQSRALFNDKLSLSS